MSKTTKIIAALGVVAGLGVAALPAFTYAESTTGDVEVDVEVLPAIAMTIVGNNDDGSVVSFGDARISYTAVTPEGDENPSEKGWYVENAGAYTLAVDTSVQPGTTYYEQSSRSSYNPVAAFSPDTAANSTIDTYNTGAASINALSSSAWKMLPNDIKEGGEFKSTITVYTNNATGYNLTLKDADTDNSLKQSGTGTVPTIRAVGTAENPIQRGKDAWGYRVSSQHGTPIAEPAAWAAVPVSTATPASISSFDTKTSNGDQTIVEYGVSTAADQATGIYRDTIVYTATTK